MSRSRRYVRGNATIEFTMVGIPLVFVLISTIEMARGMWIYHTLAYAIREGTRYVVPRGQNSPTPTTYQNVCTVIVQAGTGLLPEDLTLTFYSTSFPGGITVAANKCTGDRWPPGYNVTDAWPPVDNRLDNQPGQTISIRGQYPFVSAISMFWPGAGPGMTFQNLTCNGPLALCLPAASQDVMQF